MIRFFHVDVRERIRNYFTEDRCLAALDVIMQSQKTPQALICAFILIPDGRDNIMGKSKERF